MKKIKLASIALSLLLGITAFSGCMVINSQKMKHVKGTYQLTSYTYTPKHERKANTTPYTVDYIADRGYEVYLVVTGENKGYYVHKDNETEAYATVVDLSYEYDTEDTSKVSYVQYRTSVETASGAEWNRFGVTKDSLTYNLPSIDYTELITKKPMSTQSIYKSWKKVDKATDLSFVKKQLGEIKEYSYEDFALKDAENSSETE